MIFNYPYLKDSTFLKNFDLEHLKKLYIKITFLNWNEDPIQEVQGYTTSGSLNIDGSSSMRRTANLTMILPKEEDAKITNINSLFSINKKVYIEIGYKNNTDKYKDYDIIWFPQGLFILINAPISNGTDGTQISLQLKDKMCLLNGECGGTIPASTEFDSYDTIDKNGEWILSKPTIGQIIREAVNHFGGEQLGKIIISDVDTKLKMCMKWIGQNPVYLINDHGSYSLTTDSSKAFSTGYQTFSYGEDVGFIYTDFTSPKELIGDAGTTVTDLLDNIVAMLGNYEYFYDIYGNFVFQEIKNYLNTTHATIEIEKIKNSDYLVDASKGKAVYDFNSEMIINSSNSPQYNNIKNDYIVWGVKQTTEGVSVPVRYHLAIDEKPQIGNFYQVFFYEDEDGIIKAKVPMKYKNKKFFPKTGIEGEFYLDESSKIIYIWDVERLNYITSYGAEVKDYDSKSLFPKDGDINYVYRDVSENKVYCWGVDESSEKASEVRLEIAKNNNEYQEQIDLLIKETDKLRAEIAEKNLLLERFGDWTKEDYDTQIEKLTESSIKYDEGINTYESVLAQKNLQIDKDIKTINEIEEAIEVETDPEKIEKLEQQLSELQTQLKSLSDSKNIIVKAIANQTDIYNKTIEKIALLEEISDKIGNMHEEIAELEEQISEITDRILAIKKLKNKNEEDKYNTLYEYLEIKIAKIVWVKTTDWRSELYLQGVAAEPLGVSSNYYYAELANEWPKIYNLIANKKSDSEHGVYYEGAFFEDYLKNPNSIDYFLDFIDSQSAVSEFSVNAIGRRSLIENKDDINCVFEADIPDFIYIESGQKDTQEKVQECVLRGQQYIQVDSNVYKNLVTGGTQNSAYIEIKDLLYSHTKYNESISISTLPVYYLEPNVRIKVTDEKTDISGEYIIKSYSLPLSIEGAMSISAVRPIEKL